MTHDVWTCKVSDASSATTLCPNCVSPWKCNGPHVGDAPPHGYEDSSATSEAEFAEMTRKGREAWKDVPDVAAWINEQRGGSATSEASEVTQTLVRQLIERDAKGRVKYGKTLDRTDLSRDEWLQHLIEELLDAAGYAEAAKRAQQQRQPQGDKENNDV